MAGPAGIDIALLEATLDDIRPVLHGDGGDLILLGVDEEGIVRIELVGACGTCPLITVTLVAGIEVLVKQQVPGVTGVVAQSPVLPGL